MNKINRLGSHLTKNQKKQKLHKNLNLHCRQKIRLLLRLFDSVL